LQSEKKYQHLFFDLDHTLWDFEANARATLAELHGSLGLHERGVTDFDLFHRNYLEHNERLWEKYRNGQIRQDELRQKRMALALLDFRIADEGLTLEMSTKFLELLPTRKILFPDTIETLSYLADRGYKMHMITNGFEVTQHSKLKYSGLDRFFTEVITSEGSNSLKPHREIFDYAMRKTGATPANSIMIGDSIEVDIAGAFNAGLHQVHVNYTSGSPVAMNKRTFPTYTIYKLKELKSIL
jgi:putative hydrolase of the HAD superfamily